MLLAIDPGVDTGWALFLSSGRLIDCGLGHPGQSQHFRTRDLARVVIEHPMIYPRGQTPDPNAIVRLAVNAGEWGGRFGPFADVTYVFPNRWKGSVPKDIHQARVWAKLSEEEKTVVDLSIRARRRVSPGRPPNTPEPPQILPLRTKIAPSKRHNMLDAIGLGLYTLGRA